MSRVFRVAVLECDTPFPAVKDARGSYGDIFRDLLAKGLSSLGPKGHGIDLQVTKWDVVTLQYPQILEADGFIITGSRHNAFDNDPWILSLVDFVKSVLEIPAKPVLGICFGHQIIGRALGAKVDVNPGGWEVSVEKVDMNEEGQRVLGASSLYLHQMHRDAVLEVPQGVINLGSSPRCTVQSLYKPGRLLSFQGHPEFDSFINGEILRSRHKSGMFDDRMFGDAINRIDDPHSADYLTVKIWDFFFESQPLSSFASTVRVPAVQANL